MRTLALDLDGTIADSLPDIARAANAMLAARSLPAVTREQVAPMVGDGVGTLVDRLFAAAGNTADPGAVRDYLTLYDADVAGATTLFPGMAATLTTFARDGWTLVVCTNKPEAIARRLLTSLGIIDRFAAIGGGDSFATRKPDPRHLLSTLEQAGTDPRHAMMVGDHAHDITAAHGAGIRAVFAAWGYGDRGMAADADAIAAAPADLPAIAARLVPR